MNRYIFKNLVKLGNQNPDLRENISPILHSIQKGASSDLEDLKGVLRDIQRSSRMYTKASEKAEDILKDIRSSGVFLWDSEFDDKVENLLGGILKDTQSMLKVEDQRKAHEEHLEPLRKLKESLPEKYDKDRYLEKRKENLLYRLKKDLNYLNGRSRHEPNPEIRGNTLIGSYRAENISKEFSQQTDRQWGREINRAEKEIGKIVKDYSEVVKDYSVRRGDKNYVEVHIQLK